MASISCYWSPKTEIRKSAIGGNGLFAKDLISKGDVVFIKAGHIVDYATMQQLTQDIGEYDLQIADDFFLCPTTKEEIENLAVCFNHSCDPTAGPDGQVVFVALRDIQKGEEITVDYATITAYPYQLSCNCGSKHCRKTVTGDDWKRKDLQEKYGDHFSWFILKKILNATQPSE